MKNYYIYLRKSRADNPQEAIENVLERHENILQKYAKEKLGFKIADDYIFREVVSGETIDARPKMQKLLSCIEEGCVTAVLIVEPQRLTRGDLSDCGRIINTFKYSDTPIITPQKTYNLNEKYDRKFFEMELMRGNDYLEYTKEILARGRLSSVSEGKYIGNTAPYGYNRYKLPDQKGWSLAINEEEASVVKLIYKLYLEDSIGAVKIADTLTALKFKPRNKKYWTAPTVREILTNIAYTGKIKFGERALVKTMQNGQIVKSRPRSKSYIIADGLHKAIIDEDTFNAVQIKLESHTVVNQKSKNDDIANPLSGILICSDCGAKIQQRPKGGRTAQDSLLCKTRNCPCVGSYTYIVENRLLEALAVWLKDYKLNTAHKASDTNIYERSLKTLTDNLNTLNTQLENAYTFVETGIYTKEIFAKRYRELTEQIDSTKISIKQINETIKAENKKNSLEKEAVTSCEALIENYFLLSSNKLKNDLLKKVLKKAEYTKHKGGAGYLDSFTLKIFPKI